MEQHLERGCGDCGAIFAFLRQVTDVASAEAAYEEPSARLSAVARGVFRASAERSWGERVAVAFETLLASLTFDSAAGLQAVGVRGDRTASRQMLYQAGDYCIDLRLDRERDSMKIILVGQVANQKDPLLQLARLPVFVLDGKKVVSETASNQFGEFTLEFVPRQNLRLCVQVTQTGHQLEVPLKRSLEEHET
jgi:hypothetical protein